MMLTWFARDDTPVLMGPRVTLRAPRPSDYMAWRSLRKESRDFLKPYEPSSAARKEVVTPTPAGSKPGKQKLAFLLGGGPRSNA